MIDPDASLKNDPVALIGEFTTDCIFSLSRDDDLYSLALIFTEDFQLKVTAASTIFAKYVNRSEQTVEKWRVKFRLYAQI